LILNTKSNKFKQFEAKQLVGILSCFTNISVAEEKRHVLPYSTYKGIQEFVLETCDMYKKCQDSEAKNNINTGIDYSMHFDLIDYSIKWCECESDAQCKELIQKIAHEKEIFLGEFIKAILKINNISAEMEKVAEYLGDIEMLHKFRQIPEITLKFVATNQSLYV
jgi:hypothetical protein